MYQEISNSSWQGILTQYWGLGGFVSKSLAIGTPYTDSSVSAPTGVDLNKIIGEVNAAISANPSWPQSPGPNDQFVVFVPSGATYASETEHANCGFHGTIEGYLAYVYVGWNAESGGQLHECKRTYTAAHEYAETVTSPLLNAWRNWSFNEEVADLCVWAEPGFLPGGIEVASLWDNYLGRCATSDAAPAQVKPEAISEAASNVRQTTAKLNATIQPNKVEIASYKFEWGATEAYGNSTQLQLWTKGLNSTPVSAELTGLSPSTTYHYRVVAYFAESGYHLLGNDRRFATGPVGSVSPPVASPSTPAQNLPESATPGSWSGEPTSFSYRWERSAAAGGEWTSIPGATTSSYVPTAADVGYLLRVSVTARNSGGEEASASSASTDPVRAMGETTLYQLPSESRPRSIVKGPDGNLWFTEESDKIGKITPLGAITEYPLLEKSNPRSIVAGPDGNLWFTELGTNKIGKITTSGQITEYPLPKSSGPSAIAVGSDGNLWFTTCYSKKIGKITTSGVITEYLPAAGACLESITAGPDGNLWFTCMLRNKIGKITTSGSVTEYTLPEFTYPKYITAGPDGNLWFTGERRVGKITTLGVRTEYPIEATDPFKITSGSDGNLWFTIPQDGAIGRMTTSGSWTKFPAPLEPWGITTGPDGYLWFTRMPGSGNSIGRMVP